MSTAAGELYDKTIELGYQIQIGSKLFPEYPCTSLSESYTQLEKAVGIIGNNFHSMSMTPTQYRNQHFVMSIETEKSIGSSWTGVNTRAGDLLRVKLKSDTSSAEAVQATQMFIVLHSDDITKISDGGVSAFD